MGSRPFFHDEAVQYRDGFSGSDRDKRYLDHLIDQDRTRLTRIMSEQYSDSEKYAISEVEAIERICAEGSESVDDILDKLRNGELTAREAATQLGAAKRDLNKLRKTADNAARVEERAWESVNKTPGEFQRDVAKRFPALFQNGRGLLVLPSEDD